MSETTSHAFVLPDENFNQWLDALRPYLDKFPRVAVVRSPRGNDLNRYRDVTTVTAPRTWFQDDPHAHIRRIYPMVVRVDLVMASTPAQMRAELQKRIDTNDRFGEKITNPPHLFTRFTLDYPVAGRSLRIINGFEHAPDGVKQGCVELLSAPGDLVMASAGGRVARLSHANDSLGIGSYVQVLSDHNGVSYTVTYGGLRAIAVPLNSTVKVGDRLGEAAGETVRLIVQSSVGGQNGFRFPNVIDPANLLYLAHLRVQPTARGVRLRSIPSTTGEILAQVNPWDALETLETHGRTLEKVGRESQWIRVKTPDGRPAFVAAWLVEAIIRTPGTISAVNPVGVNLDFTHPLGTPDPARLGRIGWVRFGYNVSNNVGSTDIQATFNRCAPILERYVRAGYRVCMATSHQTYGEGQGFNWHQMGVAEWDRLIGRFADMMNRIAAQYRGRGLIHAWQVWNEPDAPLPEMGHIAEASVPMNAATYHRMLRAVVPAMRAADSELTILTAGFTGSQSGALYARDALAGLSANARPDGIAIHPYGRTARASQAGQDPLGHYGSIDEWLQQYMTHVPNMPIWITEWGVLNAAHVPPSEIGDYALAFIQRIKTRYAERVPAIIWYAWAETMHNGFGLVDAGGQSRPGLTERYLNA
ncbi:MAG: cellulase family glycosylhydrolase [Anaerolineae bacterium]|nr:cellulase family glycosylhydrolase [Anaerolineae bacterium]MDW8171756.1 cellulase family glycosylhydrolase [Anaerolineae bacterium]